MDVDALSLRDFIAQQCDRVIQALTGEDSGESHDDANIVVGSSSQPSAAGGDVDVAQAVISSTGIYEVDTNGVATYTINNDGGIT